VRHVRMLGVCLVAVLALGAYVVSSASAGSPEWGKCEAKVGGKYKDANCQEKAKKGEGAYEWKKGASLPNVPFTGESQGGGGVLWALNYACQEGGNGNVLLGPIGHPLSKPQCEAKGDQAVENGDLAIECEKENAIGEASGKSSFVNVHVTFKGCRLYGGSPCTGEIAGEEEGEINTNALKGSLGVLNKGTKEVGAVLEPAKKHGAFASFTCGGGANHATVGVGNSKDGSYWTPESKGGLDQIISPITPVNQMTTTFTQVYSVAEGTIVENLPTHLEGKARSGLEWFNESYSGETRFGQGMWASAGEEITNVNTPEKPGEIKY
jgi:hypothetical protein